MIPYIFFIFVFNFMHYKYKHNYILLIGIYYFPSEIAKSESRFQQYIIDFCNTNLYQFRYFNTASIGNVIVYY